MSDCRCPACQQWATAEDWESAPPGSFTIRCPRCGATADTVNVGYRLTVTPAATAAGFVDGGATHARPAAHPAALAGHTL